MTNNTYNKLKINYRNGDFEAVVIAPVTLDVSSDFYNRMKVLNEVPVSLPDVFVIEKDDGDIMFLHLREVSSFVLVKTNDE